MAKKKKPKETVLARVRVGDAELVLIDGSLEWRGEDEELLKKARAMREQFKYHPADGYPGARLAWEVAEALQGEVVEVNIPPIRPDVLY